MYGYIMFVTMRNYPAHLDEGTKVQRSQEICPTSLVSKSVLFYPLKPQGQWAPGNQQERDVTAGRVGEDLNRIRRGTTQWYFVSLVIAARTSSGRSLEGMCGKAHRWKSPLTLCCSASKVPHHQVSGHLSRNCVSLSCAVHVACQEARTLLPLCYVPSVRLPFCLSGQGYEWKGL